jgi:hypothetical protein
MGAGADDDALLPLPAWTEHDMSLLNEENGSIPLGGYLWPDGLNPDSLLPPETSPTRVPPESLMAADSVGLLSSTHRQGFLLFIPKPRPVVAGKTPPAVTPPQKMVDVGADFLRECESLEPDAGLLDPHGLLAETDSEDLRRLLTYHAGQASTFANILLLDSDQQLPASADLSRIARGRLVQDHACLTVYPLAEPWRARLFMTREITDKVPMSYLRGILQACVQDAMQASDPVEQLQRFATQLSIRLIWMERAHADVFAIPDENVAPEPSPPPALAEVTSAPALIRTAPPLLLRWQPIAFVAATALASLLGLLLAWRIARRWHRRRMRNSVWILPEVEVKQRYGAPHCGQGGAWIRFG